MALAQRPRIGLKDVVYAVLNEYFLRTWLVSWGTLTRSGRS
jgi:hypothetical protein